MSGELTELKNIDKLIKKSRPMISSKETAPEIDFSTKEKALSIVYDGYTTLPKLYHKVFLDPLKNLITNEDYAGILNAIYQNGKGPWEDWLASINQRTIGYNKEATHAFEEFIEDGYAGFLDMEARRNIKPPDYEAVSPLVKWGAGPYTWPADTGISLGMNMAVVSMPPSFSGNIALWSALAHELYGHDFLHADKGLLNEITNVVSTKIMKNKNSPGLKNQEAIVNGRKMPVAKFAALYWKYTMDETASDICGLLNLGPAAGVGVAAILIPLRGGKLITNLPPSDEHPIDALRILLAADVIRNIPDLDADIANAWGDALEGIVNKYIANKNEFQLGSGIRIPFKGMRETVKIVAKTIAFTPLNSLEGHSINEINTWTNSDEALTLRIADDFLNNRQTSLKPGPDGEVVYPAHILSGAVIALAESADIPTISELAVTTLNELYNSDPVWHGFPVAFRSNANFRSLI